MVKAVTRADLRRAAPQSPARGRRRRAEPASTLSRLQRHAGNHALAGAMQARLRGGPQDDPLEREADTVADSVVSGTQGPCACGGHTGAGAGPPVTGPDAVIPTVARDPGQPLDAASTADLEPRLGRNLSGVRVHTGEEAARSAAEIDAQAYTVGRHIVFGRGRYQPATAEGRHLVAHELTHVVQQSQGEATVQRKPAGGREDPVRVAPMDPAQAMQVIAEELASTPDTSQAALMAIAATLRMPFTAENAALRVRRLSAAVSLLDAPEAQIVLDALTRPANAPQKALRAQFMRLDHRTREPLLVMLDDRAGRTGEAAPEAAPAAPRAASGSWAKVDDGVFAYITPQGVTVDDVANHVSGYEGLAKILAELNGVERRKRLPKATPIIVPAEYISRPGALAELPEALRAEIVETQRAQADAAAFRRFVTVKSGHPAGPGAVGLAPLTLSPLIRPGVWEALKYAAGFVVGLLEGAYDAVKDLFVGAWQMIEAVGKLLYRLITGNLGAIVRTVKGWIAQLQLLWAKRAEIAADFMGKWDAKDPWDRGQFRGEVLGWVMTTVLIVIVTWGEGAIEQIAGKWANVVKVLNVAQKAGDVATYAGAFAKIADKTVQVAIDALRASGLGKVVEVGAIAAKPIVWTANGLRAALALPGRIADELTDAVAERLRVLAPYVERIKNLSSRAKRWLFGCHSPCDWNPEFVLREMEHPDGEIEARALRELGEEDWDVSELENVGETPVKADPRARGYAIEDRHMLEVEQEGFERLPDWFRTHDAYRGGTVSKVVENGREITVITRPETLSIKSTWITDPTRLTETVEGYFATLRGRFEHTRGGVRVVGASTRTLDLIFEEGTRLTPDTLRALEQLEQSAGSIRFRWYVLQSDRMVPSSKYLRAMRMVP